MPRIGFVTVSLWCLSLKVTNLWCSGHFRAFTYFDIFCYSHETWFHQCNNKLPSQPNGLEIPTNKEGRTCSKLTARKRRCLYIHKLYVCHMFMVIHILSLRFPEETWASGLWGTILPSSSQWIANCDFSAPQGGGVESPNHRDPCRRRKTLLFKLKPGFYGGSTPSFRIKNVKTPNRMNVSHITIHQQNREKSTFEFLGGNHFWAARPKICFFYYK